MSDTLKYLDKSGSVAEGDAAQSFLQDKLKDGMKGRYTSEQYDRLMESGGPAVVNSSDGHINTGPAYPQNDFLKEGGGSSSSGSSDYKAQYENQTEKFGSLSDLGFSDERIQQIRDHASNLETDGPYEGFSKEYGFSSDTENNFRELDDPTGEGSIQADMRKIAKHMGYGHSGDANYKRIKDYIMEGGGDSGSNGEQKPDPIEHSPEMKQAVERVRTYENDVMSGKMSEDVFGSINQDDAGPAAAFDSSKGMAGIGTDVGVNADNGAYKATNSFLDNKKSEIKKEFNFKPVQYGNS